MSSNNINPIFIIGAPRTGTTWLGNIIASRFNTSTAIHPLHYGVKEANLYLNHKYWGDFNSIDQYISFLQLYEASDFFQILNLDIKLFYNKRYFNFYEFFFDLMDHYAEKEGKKILVCKIMPKFFWDQKEMNLVLSLIQKKVCLSKIHNYRKKYR